MRNEKGSITLYVLISMIFFLIIAMTAYVSAMSKLQGQNEEIEQIKASYEQDLTEEGLLKLYNKATKTRQWLVGSGTKEDTYKIYTIEDLLEFSNRVNGGENFNGKYIELMNDLDFRKDKSYEKADRTDFGDVNNNGTVEPLKTELTTGEGWQPIGIDSKPFSGIFQGNKHEIINMYINKTSNNQGLFGFSTGTIQEITVRGVVKSTGTQIGGIVGYIYRNGKISNCTSYVNVNGNTYVGGIAGRVFEGNIEQCNNNMEVRGSSNVGGITGYIGASKIQKCINNANIIATTTVGGICAQTLGTNIELCANNGNITGNYSGGIMGYSQNNNPYIKNCFNIGKIEGNTRVRGIGMVQINNCYNVGEIIASSYGSSIGGTNTNSYYLSTLTTSDPYATSKSSSEMKTQEFVDLLNTNNDDAPWEVDTTNINNGYPILKWQLNNNN